LVILTCWVSTDFARANDALRVIAAMGESIPGLDAGWVFDDLISSAYSVEFHGRDHLSFVARATNSELGASLDGLWEYNQGTYTLLAYSGMPLPDGSALEPIYFATTPEAPGTFAVNSFDGQVRSIWTNRTGVLERVAGGGDSIGASGGDVIRSVGLGREALSNDGHLQFEASVLASGAPVDQSYWAYFSDLSGTMTPILTQHDAVPGMPGAVFSDAGPQNGSASRDGVGFITPAVVSEIVDYDPALIAYDGQTLQLIAAPGLPVEGDIPGLEFLRPLQDIFRDNLVVPSYSNAGHAAFIAYVKVPGVDLDNDPIESLVLGTSVWRWHDGELELVLRSGQTPDGFFDPIAFAPGDVAINNLGQVAFDGGVAGLDDFWGTYESALWSDRSGSLEIVLRKNDIALTSIGNVKFEDFWGDESLAINDQGQIVFMAGFSHVDTGESGQGFFVLNLDGTVDVLARAGQNVALPAGGSVEIPGLGYYGAAIATIPFNEQGQAVLFGKNFFTGKSALLLSDAALVPEPSSLVLAALGALGTLAILAQRRRTAPRC